jgi:signal transduction histidine kinase
MFQAATNRETADLYVGTEAPAPYRQRRMDDRAPILYVDDEQANLTVFKAAFGNELRVLTAGGGEEALALLAQQPVAVLLTDQRMPGMSGVELAARVKELYPDTVRMILTAYSDSETAIEAINRGEVSRYIGKPWQRRDLVAILKDGVEVFRLRTQLSQLQLKMAETTRLQMLGFVSAGVAHDLKSPLACLITVLDTFAHELAKVTKELPPLAPRLQLLQELAGDGRLACDQIRTMVDSIRRHGAERPVERTRVDLGKLAETTLRLCRAELAKRAQLSVDLQSCPPIEGNAGELGQAVMNLLVNAAQAIDDASPGPKRIWLKVFGKDGAATLEVGDTGRGISPELVSRIFDPFFTTKTTSGGTGLGLAIVRDVVTKHEGEINVQSKVSEGTVITVTFRAMAPPSTSSG